MYNHGCTCTGVSKKTPFIGRTWVCSEENSTENRRSHFLFRGHCERFLVCSLPTYPIIPDSLKKKKKNRLHHFTYTFTQYFMII